MSNPGETYRQDHTLKERVLNAAESAGQGFAHDDRKDDEDLTWDELREAFESGVVTMDEAASAFIQGCRREGL